MDYQKLFNYMQNEHDVTLLKSDMQEIVRIVNQMQGIPSDEEICEMSKSELEVLMYFYIQKRMDAFKNNKFDKAQKYGDLVHKVNQLLEV